LISYQIKTAIELSEIWTHIFCGRIIKKNNFILKVRPRRKKERREEERERKDEKDERGKRTRRTRTRTRTGRRGEAAPGAGVRAGIVFKSATGKLLNN
jgi:hypothetical protein